MITQQTKPFWGLFLLCNLVLLTCNAKSKRYEAIYQAGYIHPQIVHIERSDTATVVSLSCNQCPGDEVFCVDATFHLNDEKQNRYPLRHAEGIKFGEKTIFPFSGILEFTLVFDAMPKDVEIFDLLSSDTEHPAFAFWGIHEKKYKLKHIPHIPGKKAFRNEYIMKKGNACVRGKIENYEPQDKKDRLAIYSVIHQNNQLQQPSYKVDINPNGTFEFNLPIENTMWHYIEGNELHLPVIINPGDTTNILIKNYGKYDMTAEYTSSLGYNTMSQLMKAAPGFTDSDLLRKRLKTIPAPELHQDMAIRKSANHQLCDYLSWKYKLSDIESHLLLLSMNTVVEGIALQRLNENIKQVFLHEDGVYLTENLKPISYRPEVIDSYSFMEDINMSDYSYFVLPRQFLITHIIIRPCRFFMTPEERIDILEKYLKQELDEEWRKRIHI